MEKVKPVTIRNASFILAVASIADTDCNWKAVTMSDEAAILLRAILSSVLQAPNSATSTLSREGKLTVERDSMHLELPCIPRLELNSANELDSTASLAVENQVSIFSNYLLLDDSHGSSESVSHFTATAAIPGYMSPIEIFRKALHSKEWADSQVQEVAIRAIT